jgi:tetratricopeptide (TPR) repeat protein
MKYMFIKGFRFLPAVLLITLASFVSSCKNGNEEQRPAAKIDPELQILTDNIVKNPKNADAYYNRAKYYFDSEAYDESIFDLASAMKVDSMKAKYYHLLADNYMDYYQSRMALMTMQKASGMFPDSIRTLLKLTEFEIILKKYDAAMQTVKTILEKDKQNADAYIMMGTILEESGDNKRALLAYKRSTEIDPFLIDGWIKTGSLADKMNEKDAEKYFKTAMKVDTNSYTAIYALAMHYQNKNDRANAISWYKNMNLKYPKVPQPYFNIGVLYNEMDSLDKALEFLTIATSLDKIYSEAYYAKGVVLEKQGKLTEAQREYSQASTLNPKFTVAEQASNRLKAKINKK